MRRTETAGLSLAGAIDGVNQRFTTSLPMRLDYVDVILNGRIKAALLDDGYTLPDNRTVLMREPPLPGDTVQVSYAVEVSPGGQAGGVPSAPCVDILEGPCIKLDTFEAPTARVKGGRCCLAD